MNMNKLTRELDTRDSELQPTATWAPPELLPQPDPRPGWVHRYVRSALYGNADPMSVSTRRREGFEPVKAEDYPELHAHVSLEGRFKGSIEIGGLVLCRAPEEMMKQRAAYYARMNETQMNSVDDNFMSAQDSRMPGLFKQRTTKVTFGKGS